ncbi:uncharacterized protein FPRO_05423 [Fusarium proliferatum ET1]|uniref:Uncharacterized protein n=1 Tax=Fusarium proliferatum (strain ET1) TaxID=1227346 RepID=A0A1L7VIV5_FUSPR|nr:uncharacterized protein FPRO_05423 [Fusarium proliferatum ET1]CZR40523.1 uncharacterized protein FPRO_05423 [Fusarium proliferatum ET1]
MATRELLIVILNHTNEELTAEPEWPHLNRGNWTKSPDLQPPQTILTGETGMLRCKSSHIGEGIDGSITYRIIRFEGRNELAFMWSVPYVGANKFDACCAVSDFTVEVLGGRGKEAVVVFLFVNANDFAGSAKMTDVRPGDGVWAAVTRYPVECAKGLVGGFNHH